MMCLYKILLIRYIGGKELVASDEGGAKEMVHSSIAVVNGQYAKFIAVIWATGEVRLTKFYFSGKFWHFLV